MTTSNHLSASELRKKFLDFFEQRGHKVIPSASLIPENDPTVLFTTAGMQQFKRYYLFPDEASSARITTCQKCVRTVDIDEVGDETHLTFFEMLGNFSFGYAKKEGSYFKEKAIKLAWEFLTEELKIEKSRIYATYFKDDTAEVPEDNESLEILQKIEGLSDVKPQGLDDNFWSLGTEGSPGGPTVEFYIDGVEIWNLVFNEFVMKNGKYEPAELKGIDTGMGLERLAVMIQDKSDVYQTDIFEAIVSKIEEISNLKYGEGPDDNFENCWIEVRKSMRIVADHIRSAEAMILDGVVPANKDQGYVLRRLIRRAVVQGRKISLSDNFTSLLANDGKAKQELEKEETKFRKTLEKGLKILSSQDNFDGKTIFDLHQTYGIPVEIAIEEVEASGEKILDSDLKEFRKLQSEHQEQSRTASAGMFKGGLADNKEATTKLHTAAHLLLVALKEVLGPQVEQKGSNITEERLRFDFNNPGKLTDEQLGRIEAIVNEQIEKSLPVTMEEMTLDEAKKSGAHGTFSDRYGDKVKVYTIGSNDEPFSCEICGGPHVSNTSELGHFKITKEESSSSGVRRIKAVLS